MSLHFPGPLAAAASIALAAGLGWMPSASAQAPAATTSSDHAGERISLQRGVAVVAMGTDATDATWALASRVYADPLLRPIQLDEPTARVLAGEEAGARAAPRMRELAIARQALRPGDPLVPRLAESISAELGGASLLLVHMASPAQPRALLYSASKRALVTPELWQQPDARGVRSWEAAVGWLHAHALASQPRAPARAPGSKSVLASGWFWGALGAAAAVAVVIVAVGRDDSADTVHVQGRLGP